MIDTEKRYLKTYKKGLILSAQKHIDIGISNRLNNGRTNIAHEVLFDQSDKGLIMFAEGFRQGIFDTENVINSFKNLVKRMLESNNIHTKPVLELIIKDDYYDLIEKLDKSSFYKEVKRISKRFNKELIEIYYISPKEEISVPYIFKIQSNRDGDKDIIVSENNNKIRVSDINTFQVFSEDYLRVREDVDYPHDSEAIINCGKDKATLANVKIAFDFIKSKSKKYTNLQILDTETK